MGIYITNMEMPKGIEMIVVFSNGTVHKCLPGMREYVEKGTAVPVPPHGDLIERDALIKQARTQFDWNDVVDVEDIANAPTIIPAEEE